jgi:co-chaperonin GroES (HSP10)
MHFAQQVYLLQTFFLPGDFLMSKSYLEPANDYVMVVDSPRETTIDGIIMPDNQKQQEMVFGTVIFVGPEALKTMPEDRVCYGPYAGKTVVIDGVEFRIIRQGQIEGYIRKSQ